jgi:hypothetical protein
MVAWVLLPAKSPENTHKKEPGVCNHCGQSRCRFAVVN